MSIILQQKADWDCFRQTYERMETIGLEYHFIHTGKKVITVEVVEMTDYHFVVTVTEWGAMGSFTDESYKIPFDYLYNYDWQMKVKEKIENDKMLAAIKDRKYKKEKADQQRLQKKQDEQLEKELYEQLKKKFEPNGGSSK